VLDPNTIALLNQLGFDTGYVESLMSSAILLSILALVTAIPTGAIAKRKGRSKAFWVLFSLTIPLIPLLLIWFLPAVPGDGAVPKKRE
jgi:hypothetical protein